MLELARKSGADEVILYTQQDFEEETRRLTDGKGVHAIYDGVGKTTFDKDLNVLRPRGYLILFKVGPVGQFRPSIPYNSRERVPSSLLVRHSSITSRPMTSFSSARPLCCK